MVITDFAFLDKADAATYDGTLKAYVTTSSGNGAFMRSGPGTNNSQVDGLSEYTLVTIIGDGKDSSGMLWYQVETADKKRGYIRSDLLTIKEVKPFISDADFEKQVAKFPESYKSYLLELHAAHPAWIFVPLETGLDWDQATTVESTVKKAGSSTTTPSTVDGNSIASWKSTSPLAMTYNEETGTYKWKSFDSGNWPAASKAIVQYYMDPRNFLTEAKIFQFLDLHFDENTQTRTGLSSVIKGTFMDDKNTHDAAYFGEDYANYGDLIMDAGRESMVSPYVLASMIIIEQGADGKGGSITGTQSKFEGFYNFYNIRAYKSGSYSAVQYGLLYAQATDPSIKRPWDSRAKSIKGGALWYAKNYVLNNKSNLYLKKWNVMNGIENVGIGQYMTNVEGAASEASQMRKAYQNMIDEAYTFSIPVFNNMPSKPCVKPTGTTVVLEGEEPPQELTDEEKAKLEEEQKKKEEEERLKKEEEERKAQEAAELQAKWDKYNSLKEGVENTTIKLTTALNGTKGIKLTWVKSAGYKVDYYEIYRTTDSAKDAEYDLIYTTSKGTTKSISNKKGLKKGKKYYYKMHGVRTLTDPDGNEVVVYTKWSGRGARTYK